MRFKYRVRDKKGMVKEGFIIADSLESVVTNFHKFEFTDVTVAPVSEKLEDRVEMMPLKKVGTTRCPNCKELIGITEAKCPYCGVSFIESEEIASPRGNETVKHEFHLSDLYTHINFILVAVAIFSFFIPFARLEFSETGSHFISGFSVLSQSVRPLEEEGTVNIGMTDLENMAVRNDSEGYLEEKLVYGFIPLGLKCGFLAYVSLAAVLACLVFGQPLLSSIISAVTVVLSLFFMVSLFLLNDLLRFQMDATLKNGVRITPAAAIYLVIIPACFICIFSWLEKDLVRVER